MGHTALVLGDQLSHANPALEGADRVLIVESRAALGRLRLHRQRRHLVLSAMRHYAAELRERGEVEVVERRDARRMGDVLGEYGEVVCAEPNSIPSRRALERLGVRFVASSENRRPAREGLTALDPWLPEEDAIDEEVRRDLDAMDLPECGEDGPRLWPATHSLSRRRGRLRARRRPAACTSCAARTGARRTRSARSARCPRRSGHGRPTPSACARRSRTSARPPTPTTSSG